MTTNLDRYKKDLEKLVNTGRDLLHSMYKDYAPVEFEAAIKSAGADSKTVLPQLGIFRDGYQAWYSESKALVRQLLPDRFDDFVSHYEKPTTRKAISFENYRIADSLHGISVGTGTSPKSAIPHFQQQLQILESARARFESTLFDIRQLLQADLFDSEIDVRRFDLPS